MISRLLELELSGFRCFASAATVPLDANVVLIHGTNGTGKTSLLSALEFALTGRVEELAAFEEDYPRCLKHVHSQGPAKASVRFLGDNQDEVTASQQTDAPFSAALPSDETRFFRDRCYLSQSSLGRLLETYQASSKDAPEQPLVRFVRELLGLDLLENLTAGLHQAGNITRIEKSVPALAKAREDYNVFGSRIQKLNEELPVRLSSWQRALTAVQRVVAEVSDPAPGEPWTVEGVIKRVDEQRRSARQTAGNVQQLRNAEGRLQRSIGLLTTISTSPTPAKLREQLAKLESRQQTLAALFAPVLERAETLLRNRGQQSTGVGDLAVRLTATEAALSTVLKRRQAEDEALRQTTLQISQLRGRLDALAKEIKDITPTQEAPGSLSQRWATLLGSILEHLQGEDCPVCGRNYSELSRGELRSHIEDQIKRLGADAKRVEEAARRREQFLAENTTVARRLIAIEAQFRADQARQERETAEKPELEKLVADLADLTPGRAEWASNIAILTSVRNDLAASEKLQHQRSEAMSTVEEVWKIFALPAAVRRQDPQAFAAAAAESVSKQADAVEKQSLAADRLREVLDQARSAGEAWQKVERELAECNRLQRKAQAVETAMKLDLESARELSRAATRAKTRLLEQVFNEKLNSLWRDLFIRLVKDEQFHPHLADPQTLRGLIRTTIEGCRDGVEPFKQFAAIASSGNLNTAALSLFLSLHLIEQPRHRFLVLDDPVQAMDDVHVVQLANLLREIRRQAQRQIIVAVHEKALFDYLCLELGPIDRHSTLLTVELNGTGIDRSRNIEARRHSWKADKVLFGS